MRASQPERFIEVSGPRMLGTRTPAIPDERYRFRALMQEFSANEPTPNMLPIERHSRRRP